ncbi:hypothetical protein PGT21_036738 [Puccinia graminis f. sp. tritici]|uniref:Uncharacterized protein n=1 Tax=Puccinia graminis f. sp. tritici TaxID=56615 RepID=A0A5B0PBW3_PUCGR|nr:hypothetical protein PGT21_036738 [Puccinia graminis f. sp. tritici]
MPLFVTYPNNPSSHSPWPIGPLRPSCITVSCMARMKNRHRRGPPADTSGPPPELLDDLRARALLSAHPGLSPELDHPPPDLNHPPPDLNHPPPDPVDTVK